jgi:hypothetical protein
MLDNQRADNTNSLVFIKFQHGLYEYEILLFKNYKTMTTITSKCVVACMTQIYDSTDVNLPI